MGTRSKGKRFMSIVTVTSKKDKDGNQTQSYKQIVGRTKGAFGKRG